MTESTALSKTGVKRCITTPSEMATIASSASATRGRNRQEAVAEQQPVIRLGRTMTSQQPTSRNTTYENSRSDWKSVLP